MDYTANDNLDHHDLEKWLEVSAADSQAKPNARAKKRRKPLRKNRRPSRPENHIGQRTNNRLLKICSKGIIPQQQVEQ